MRQARFAVGFFCLAVHFVFGQDVRLKFDAASVRPSRPFVPGQSVQAKFGGPGTNDPIHFRWENLPLASIIESAYMIRSQQLADGLKDHSLLTDRYDIITNIPPGTTLEQANIMMQNLLAERFKLAVHHETRSLSVYELVVSKGGLKMKESGTNAVKPPDGFPVLRQGQTIAITAQAASGYPSDRHVLVTAAGHSLICPPPPPGSPYFCSNPFFVMVLGSVSGGRIIVDKTGLTGKYDFALDYVYSAGSPFPTAGDSGPSLFEALEQELGLKLEDTKEPFDVLVVDHVEKPSEN